jgi:hypothetical protein
MTEDFREFSIPQRKCWDSTLILPIIAFSHILLDFHPIRNCERVSWIKNKWNKTMQDSKTRTECQPVTLSSSELEGGTVCAGLQVGEVGSIRYSEQIWFQNKQFCLNPRCWSRVFSAGCLARILMLSICACVTFKGRATECYHAFSARSSLIFRSITLCPLMDERLLAGGHRIKSGSLKTPCGSSGC